MRENTDQKNPEYGHFPRSDKYYANTTTLLTLFTLLMENFFVLKICSVTSQQNELFGKKFLKEKFRDQIQTAEISRPEIFRNLFTGSASRQHMSRSQTCYPKPKVWLLSDIQMDELQDIILKWVQYCASP